MLCTVFAFHYRLPAQGKNRSFVARAWPKHVVTSGTVDKLCDARRFVEPLVARPNDQRVGLAVACGGSGGIQRTARLTCQTLALLVFVQIGVVYSALGAVNAWHVHHDGRFHHVQGGCHAELNMLCCSILRKEGRKEEW